MAGWSAYPRQLDFAEFRRIADQVGAYLMVDMAHFAGLVAAGLHPNPVPHADVVTTTTHKTLGGPRGGVILTNDAEIAKKINSAVFPGQQGGPLEHVDRGQGGGVQDRRRAGVPRAAASAPWTAPGSWPSGCSADDVAAAGISVVTGGTDVHLVLVDLRNSELDGQQAEDRLHSIGITVNRNAVPVRPAPADGLLRPADRHPGAGHPRLRRRPSSPRWPTSSPPPCSRDLDDGARWPNCAAASPPWPRSSRCTRNLNARRRTEPT